jgi:hypothetical protein
MFHDIALKMTRRKEIKPERSANSPLAALAPLLEKLKLKR